MHPRPLDRIKVQQLCAYRLGFLVGVPIELRNTKPINLRFSITWRTSFSWAT